MYQPDSPLNSSPATASSSSLSTSLIGLWKSVVYEARRTVRLTTLKTKIKKLRHIDLLQAHHALGERCYELGLLREPCAFAFEEIDHLKKLIEKNQTGDAITSDATQAQRVKQAAFNAAAKARAGSLQLQLYQALSSLGQSAMSSTAMDLQVHREKVEAIHSAITAAEVEFATVRKQESDLQLHLQNATKFGCTHLLGFVASARRIAILCFGVISRSCTRAIPPLQKRIRSQLTQLRSLVESIHSSDIQRRYWIAGGALLALAVIFFLCSNFMGQAKIRTASGLPRVHAEQSTAPAERPIAAIEANNANTEASNVIVEASNPIDLVLKADQLAGHPDDLTKPKGIPGVSDEELAIPQKNDEALTACLAAVEAFPDYRRQLFELGRVLLLASAVDEARIYLGKAADLGHGGAMAYLGRLEPDYEKALALFDRAAVAYFPPGEKFAAEMRTHAETILSDVGRRADEFVAHLDDLIKPAIIDGAPDSTLETEKALEEALKACIDAVAIFPEEPRYRFALGRMLLIADLPDQAREHLQFAAEKEHGGAIAYLGLLETDTDKAKDYYQRAIKAGFLPAQTMLAEMESQRGPDFTKGEYNFGNLFQALYESNMEYLNESRFLYLQYISHANSGFKEAAPDSFDAKLSDSITAELQKTRKDKDKEVLVKGLSRLKRFANIIADLSANATVNDVDVDLNNVDVEPLPIVEYDDTHEKMKEDITRLISTFGADSDVTKRIQSGIKAFVTKP